MLKMSRICANITRIVTGIKKCPPATTRMFSNFHAIGMHRDTIDNTEETYFDFTEENYKRVSLILGRYPTNYRQAAIIPLLDLAQRQAGGWLPLAAMEKVAKVVNVPSGKVFEVATFYTMFNREKVFIFKKINCVLFILIPSF